MEPKGKREECRQSSFIAEEIWSMALRILGLGF